MFAFKTLLEVSFNKHKNIYSLIYHTCILLKDPCLKYCSNMVSVRWEKICLWFLYDITNHYFITIQVAHYLIFPQFCQSCYQDLVLFLHKHYLRIRFEVLLVERAKSRISGFVWELITSFTSFFSFSAYSGSFSSVWPISRPTPDSYSVVCVS